MTSEEVDDITFKVYCRRLNDDCPGGADRMLASVGEKKMRGYASVWRGLVVATLIETGLHEVVRGKRKSIPERDIDRVTPRSGTEEEVEAAE